MSRTEQACASRPLTTRIQKSMLPTLTSNFPEFFPEKNGGKKPLGNALFNGHAFRLELRRDHRSLGSRRDLGLLHNRHRFAIMTLQLRDLEALLKMRRHR